MPDAVDRWSSNILGDMGTCDTSRLRGPLCMQKSLRLFLKSTIITTKETFANNNTRISIGVSAHLALRTENQWCTWCVAFGWLPYIITSNQCSTTSTLPARIL